MIKKEEIVEVLANGYESKRRIDQETMCSILMDLSLYIKNGYRVLDLGCGSGRLLIPLAKLFPEVDFFGLDVSKGMLKNLQQQIKLEKVNNVNVIKEDFNNDNWIKKYNSEKFDLVVVFQAIHFVSNLDKFFENISKILSERGRLIIVSTTHNQFYELPYCLSFDTVLKKELSRTIDGVSIINRLVKLNYNLINQVSFQINRDFLNREDLKNWLKSRPFSVLAYLSDEQLKKGIDIFVKKYSHKQVLIDEFNMITFERNKANKITNSVG